MQELNPRSLMSSVITIALVAIAGALSAFGFVYGVLLLVLAVLILLLALFGASRVGLGAVVLAYATAPMYKGFAPSNGSTVTATDVLLVLGFGLLLPELIAGRSKAPFGYSLAVTGITLTGLISSSVSGAPTQSLVNLVLWLGAIFFLPVALLRLHPSIRVVRTLAWAYVVGQLVDTGLALAKNGTHRWAGISTHPNYFAGAALLSVTLLFFLGPGSGRRERVIIWIAGLICAAGVINSGSRAATVVLAALVVAAVFIERSARVVIAVAILSAFGILALALALPSASSSSALGRLLGQGSASGSDLQRSQGFSAGIHLFLARPFTGNGISKDVLYTIHNNLLEVAVATGIVGLAAFLLLEWFFVRVLFTRSPLRRLGYGALAYVGFGATVPGLYDRSLWSVVALAFVVYAYRSTTSAESAPEAAGGAEVLATPEGTMTVGTASSVS